LAVDTQGYSNRESIDISIVSKDTTVPYLMRDYISVKEN
jgi:hypothetical protein